MRSGVGVRNVSCCVVFLSSEADGDANAGFYMNLPIGGVAAALIAFVPIPERTTKSRITLSLVRKIIPDLDLLGFALFVPPSVMLLLALQLGSGGKYAWSSPVIIGLFCGAAACAALFILWERRMGDQAMLPGQLLKQRIVWTSCVYASCIITCMMTASVWMPTYFQAVKGDGPTDSGVHVLPSILSQLLVVIATGAAGMSLHYQTYAFGSLLFIVSRMGYYLPWALVGGIITAIGNGLVSTFTASTSASVWIGYQILLGAGRGCGMQIVSPTPAQVGVASLTLPGHHCSAERRISRPIPSRLGQCRLFPEPQYIYRCRHREHDLCADTQLSHHTLRAHNIAPGGD